MLRILMYFYESAKLVTESNYQRSFIRDFEAYSGSDKVAIYIGIK
jgi:hypothetical protein